MKLIESSAEYMPQENGIEGIYRQIEKAGRVCYKSEDRMTDKSSKEFVDRMIDNKHTAMLEQGTVYLYLPKDIDKDWDIVQRYIDNKYSCIRNFIKSDSQTNNIWHNNYIVTTNLRVIHENGWYDDLQYLCEPTDYHEKRYTFRLVASIGIVRELLRHRKFSFANESTRYCNYSADRFKNELIFVNPYWAPTYDETDWDDFLHLLYKAEKEYLRLIDSGHTPQQAREVLPLCTKSELIMTGFESNWEHFFDLRYYGTTGAPHPDMKVLAGKIKEECIKNNILNYVFTD